MPDIDRHPAVTVVCETPRLRLRHVEPDDARFILTLVNEPSWLRFIGDRGVRSEDDARQAFRRDAAAERKPVTVPERPRR